MSDFSQFFSGAGLPFKKINPTYLSGFVRKFPAGNSKIPVPGTTYYFSLPDASNTANSAQHITLVDNSTATVLRTYTDLDFNIQNANTGAAGLNAFFLDTSVTPAILYCVGVVLSGASAGQLTLYQFPADASTATTVTVSPTAGSGLPLTIKGAYRNAYEPYGYGGACFMFPDGLGNLILRGSNGNAQGSDQITISISTAAWTSQGQSWFALAPPGHSAYYTTSDNTIAIGSIVMSPISLIANAGTTFPALTKDASRGGVIDQFVSANYHVDSAEFTGSSAQFTDIVCGGCVPVLIGTQYLAFISGYSGAYPTPTSGSAYSNITEQTNKYANFFKRSDVDSLLKAIQTYLLTRFI